MSKFKKGQSGNPEGKKKGTPNKVTKTVREKFLDVFNKLQEDETSPAALVNWAQKNPREFYPLAAKLIPTEIKAQVEETIIKVVRE